MRKIKSLILTSLLLYPGGTFAHRVGSTTEPCPLIKLPLSLPSDLQLEVMNHSLSLRPEIHGMLVLRNAGQKPITGIRMLVNYEDEQGHSLFTILLQADVQPGESTPANIRNFFRGLLETPIQSGQAFDLSGTNLLTTTRIPAKEEVSVIDLRRSDGRLDTSRAGKARTDPILEQAPAEYLQLASYPDNLPEPILLRLDIGGKGAVTDIGLISPIQSRDLAYLALTSVMDRIRKWRFFPAIRGGSVEASTLFVLLRFRRETEALGRGECFLGQEDKFPSTFAVVTVKAVPGLKGNWTFFCGPYDVTGWNGPFLGQQRFLSTPFAIKDE